MWEGEEDHDNEEEEDDGEEGKQGRRGEGGFKRILGSVGRSGVCKGVRRSPTGFKGGSEGLWWLSGEGGEDEGEKRNQKGRAALRTRRGRRSEKRDRWSSSGSPQLPAPPPPGERGRGGAASGPACSNSGRSSEEAAAAAAAT